MSMSDHIELLDIRRASSTGPAASAAAVHRRLRPLRLATLLQGMMLWVPVEKLFMSEIGFTPARVGLMAGVYAVVVPLLEIPSGLLADRWSRKGVLMVATVALFAAVAVGAVAHGPSPW